METGFNKYAVREHKSFKHCVIREFSDSVLARKVTMYDSLTGLTVFPCCLSCRYSIKKDMKLENTLTAFT